MNSLSIRRLLAAMLVFGLVFSSPALAQEPEEDGVALEEIGGLGEDEVAPAEEATEDVSEEDVTAEEIVAEEVVEGNKVAPAAEGSADVEEADVEEDSVVLEEIESLEDESSALEIQTADAVDAAATPGNGATWVTGFFVTNKGTTNANVAMSFYNEQNGAAAHTFNVTVNAEDTNFYFLGDDSAFGGGSNIVGAGEYSLVLSSDQPVNAVANATSTDNGTSNSSTAYDGIVSSDTGTTLYAPIIFARYFDIFSSNFYVQNAGTTDATVNITFYGPDGNAVDALSETNVTIPAGSFIKRDQADKTAELSQRDGIYSVVVESTNNVPLAGVVNNVWYGNVQNGNSVGTANYVMFNSGANIAYVPVASNNYFGFNSSINVQNISSNAATVRIAYSNGTETTHNVGPRQSVSEFLPNVAGLPSGNDNGDLSATITADQNIVAVVGSTRPSYNNETFSSYSAENGVNAGSTTVYASATNALAFNGFDFFTSITCQNLGNEATDVTFTFSGVNTKSSNAEVSGVTGSLSTIKGSTLSSGESFVVLLNVESHRQAFTSNNNADGLPVGFNGSAKITAAQPIVCSVSQNKLQNALGTQDDLSSYTARP